MESGLSENKRMLVAELTKAQLSHSGNHNPCAQNHGQSMPKSNVGSRTYGPKTKRRVVRFEPTPAGAKKPRRTGGLKLRGTAY
jgi:hypothetical protein